MYSRKKQLLNTDINDKKFKEVLFMSDNRKGSFWDLSKRPLNMEESYFIARNLNKIEKSKQAQIESKNEFNNLLGQCPTLNSIVTALSIIMTLALLIFTIKTIICDTRIFPVLYKVLFGG